MRQFTLVSVAAILLACSHESSHGSDSRRTAKQASHAGAPAPATAYPPARWRLARPEALYPVRLRLSHILIRYEGVQPGIVSFQLPNWTPSPPPPARTAEQARALAEGISARLQKSPAEFATVARELSEDIATRDLGGALGVRSAFDYYVTPEVLDAVAVLKPGEVSRVVETQYGFHVLMNQGLPVEQTVSGVRVLIAHDAAPWLRIFLARGTVPARSRTEADLDL